MTQEETNKYLADLAKYQKRNSSLFWNFIRGIFYGLGFFIGSALLAALLVYLLSKIQGWAYVGDFIRNLIDITKNNT